jgi:TolB-like protein/class 3 adenylate cyclase/Tfp pilus assembly protein PilF
MERKLTAILAVDVVGYSAHMEADEAGTFERLKAGQKELFEPEIARHQGRVFKLMGDGLLAEFGSVVNAVECAVTLQRGMAERNASVTAGKRLEIRVGINLGEVIVDGDDRYGEGVNVAARLQQLAEPGGICVSGKVSKEVERKLAFAFEPMGPHRVKNITEPIQCFRVNLQHPSRPTEERVSAPVPNPRQAMAVAVLPFTNMSSDPEQEFFVDGLAEDLITDLSKVPGLMVIARNSSFVYKGKAMDVRSIAEDLGVDYVIEGSVRRAAARLRINVQLIKAEEGTHLWAERFDRDLSDIFLLQDEVVGRIVSALAEVLPTAKVRSRQRATNIEAYELFVRGRLMVTQSARANIASRALIQKAVELDPDFADAYAWLGMSHHCGWSYWGEPQDPHRALALDAVLRAVSLDPDNAGARAILGDMLVFDRRPEEGAAEMARALQIDPNHADAWAFLGCHSAYAGDAAEGIEQVQHAFRLNPYPPGWYYWHLGLIEYAAGRYESAADTLRNVATHRLGSQRILAAALAQLGRADEAKAEAGQFLATHPTFSIRDWLGYMPFRREMDRARFQEGYHKAGLPD